MGTNGQRQSEAPTARAPRPARLRGNGSPPARSAGPARLSPRRALAPHRAVPSTPRRAGAVRAVPGEGALPLRQLQAVRSLAHAAEQRAWGRDSDESLPRGHAPLRTGLRGRGRRGYRFRRRRWEVTVTSGRTDPLSTSEEANDKIVALEHPKLGRVTLPPKGVAAREPRAHVQ